MPYEDYTAIRVEVREGVLHAVLDHPPVNLLDTTSILELKRLVTEVREDRSVRVVVLGTADPDFFAAHVDNGFMLDPAAFGRLGQGDGDTGLNPMQHLMLSIRSLPQVTIAKLRGRLRGGGNELAMAMDMRFAAAGATWMSQIEVRSGIIPGGGGTQLLTPLVGRARALEAILSADLVDAETAARWGWVNRALPADELDAFVDGLAARIARLRPEQIAAAKAAVDGAVQHPVLADGLAAEAEALILVYPAPDEIVERSRRGLAAGMQERAAELDLEATLDRLS